MTCGHRHGNFGGVYCTNRRHVWIGGNYNDLGNFSNCVGFSSFSDCMQPIEEMYGLSMVFNSCGNERVSHLAP